VFLILLTNISLKLGLLQRYGATKNVLFLVIATPALGRARHRGLLCDFFRLFGSRAARGGRAALLPGDSFLSPGRFTVFSRFSYMRISSPCSMLFVCSCQGYSHVWLQLNGGIFFVCLTFLGTYPMYIFVSLPCVSHASFSCLGSIFDFCSFSLSWTVRG